jgi:hypothetical protein
MINRITPLTQAELEHHLDCCEPSAIRFDGLDEAIGHTGKLP